jgi:hypothetical protein
MLAMLLLLPVLRVVQAILALSKISDKTGKL